MPLTESALRNSLADLDYEPEEIELQVSKRLAKGTCVPDAPVSDSPEVDEIDKAALAFLTKAGSSNLEYEPDGDEGDDDDDDDEEEEPDGDEGGMALERASGGVAIDPMEAVTTLSEFIGDRVSEPLMKAFTGFVRSVEARLNTMGVKVDTIGGMVVAQGRATKAVLQKAGTQITDLQKAGGGATELADVVAGLKRIEARLGGPAAPMRGVFNANDYAAQPHPGDGEGKPLNKGGVANIESAKDFLFEKQQEAARSHNPGLAQQISQAIGVATRDPSQAVSLAIGYGFHQA